jgi:hypothetical protein
LGQGSFGTVYLAWDENLNRRVAVKVPRREVLATHEAQRMFLQEASAAAQLRHASIVSVFHADRLPEGGCYVVMEYVEGRTLAQILSGGRRVPAEKAIRLLTPVADAIHHAHLRRLVHRDLKPANIIVDAASTAHVADFGLALHETTQADTRGQVAGTPAYMSPEQMRGESQHLDGRSDIWSLGVILYEALTGRRPFLGRDRNELYEAIVRHEPKPLRQIDDTIPRELERICLKCLTKKVTERYTTAADLAEDLRAWQAGTGVEGAVSGSSSSGAATKPSPGNDLAEPVLHARVIEPSQPPPPPTVRPAPPAPIPGERPIAPANVATPPAAKVDVQPTVPTPAPVPLTAKFPPAPAPPVRTAPPPRPAAPISQRPEPAVAARPRSAVRWLWAGVLGAGLLLLLGMVFGKMLLPGPPQAPGARPMTTELLSVTPAADFDDPGPAAPLPGDTATDRWHQELREFVDGNVKGGLNGRLGRFVYGDVLATLDRGVDGEWDLGASTTGDGQARRVFVRDGAWSAEELTTQQAEVQEVAAERLVRRLAEGHRLSEKLLVNLQASQLALEDIGGGRFILSGELPMRRTQAGNVLDLAVVFRWQRDDGLSQEEFGFLPVDATKSFLLRLADDLSAVPGSDTSRVEVSLASFLVDSRPGYYRISNQVQCPLLKGVKWNPQVRYLVRRLVRDGLDGMFGRGLYSDVAGVIDDGLDGTWWIGSEISADGKTYEIKVKDGRLTDALVTPEREAELELDPGRIESELDSSFELPTATMATLSNPVVRIETDDNGEQRVRGSVVVAAFDTQAVQDMTISIRFLRPAGHRFNAGVTSIDLPWTQVPSQTVTFDLDLPEDALDLPKGAWLRLEAFRRQPKPRLYRITEEVHCATIGGETE